MAHYNELCKWSGGVESFPSSGCVSCLLIFPDAILLLQLFKRFTQFRIDKGNFNT